MPHDITQMNLWCIAAGVTAYTNAAAGNAVGFTVPSEQITIGDLGNLDANGELWVTLPDNDAETVTPKTTKNNYTFTVNGTKYTLTHTAYYPALTDTNRSRTILGVGEQVWLGFSPAMPYALDWNTTAGGLSTLFDAETTFTAPSNATPGVTVTASLRGGKSVTFPPFTVVEPKGIDHATIIGTNSYPLGAAGAGMTNAVWIAPTSVSFYRVNVMEIGEDATNISGFFSQWTPQQLHHNTADHWTHLNLNNELYDNAAIHNGGYLPWGAGGYGWDVPQRWQVEGTEVTNAMNGCYGSFLIDANGTTTAAKYGNWIQRTTNNVITTN